MYLLLTSHGSHALRFCGLSESGAILERRSKSDFLSNNARKRKHMVKFTRHWKVFIPIIFKNEDLYKAFGSVDEINKLINYIHEDINSQLSLYKWSGIEEVLR